MEKCFFCYFKILTFIACFLTSLAMATPHSIISDANTLLVLKHHIYLDHTQILFKNWSAGSSVCDWIGVTCGSRHKRVISLDISDMGLTGTIVPQLGNLSFLVSLSLGGNNFNGDIPQELAHLNRLKLLNFSLNSFTGEIPSWVGSFNQLEYLYLSNNSFNGSIPSSISNLTNLKELALYSNQLSGSIPFQLFNISTLERLYLADNSLSGNLPDSLCYNLQNLKQIVLWLNLLDGPLPSKLSYCSQLRSLDFAQNNFSGKIPEEFWNMKKLGTAFLHDNSLEGTIPKEISNLTSLRVLEIGECNLAGVLPKEIGNMTLLTILSIPDNNLRGPIPEELGNNFHMIYLYLGRNRLSGSIPVGLFNSSILQILDLSGNYLSGSLPSTTDFGLPNLEHFDFHYNNLSGVIPLFISNSSKLRIFDLARNNFMGVIPHYLGNLRFLEFINLSYNKLTRGSSSLELEFLKQLSNCKYLEDLQFAENPLNGILPEYIGNLSISIQNFEGSGCGISGEIPVSIGNLSNLLVLSLHDNLFTGSLPTSIVTLGNIQAIALWNNRLSGALSCNLFGLKRLSDLYLFDNLFSGAIPNCIGNGSSLRKLYLNGNRFSSNTPMRLWDLNDLLELNLSSNFLTGSLPPQVGNLKVAMFLDLSMNKLSGDIPDAVGDLQNLITLYLDNNLLEGSIPESIGKILSLQQLDLSENNLSGSIPMTFEKLMYLTFFNVSYNNLVGLIPTGGPFVNFTDESFVFNKALCGDKRFHVPTCPTTSHKKSWYKGHKSISILFFSLAASIIAITAVVICLIIRRKDKTNNSDELLGVPTNNRISFYELQQATNRYNEGNLLGKGGFGSVYKGTLGDGRVIAVKVFNLQVEGALKSFDVECEMLRNLRHRNLTQVISSCSNPNFKAIVLDFMPNGSLEIWLHSKDSFLSFMERLNIMVDVANALQYLHTGYPTPVVHADLKPSNVLLDEDKVAHVSDFGIAKMLEENSFIYTSTLGTFGYIAPEYGSEGLLTTKCDVYSFGILLMETFTRKRPNDEMFTEGMTLRGWVNNYMGSSLPDIIDDDLLNVCEKQHYAKMMECVTILLNLALDCTMEFPKERKDIREVLAALNKIKHSL